MKMMFGLRVSAAGAEAPRTKRQHVKDRLSGRPRGIRLCGRRMIIELRTDVTSRAAFGKGEISRLPKRQELRSTKSVLRATQAAQVHFAYQRVHSGYGRSPIDSIMSQPCPFLRDTATLYSTFRRRLE